MPHPRRSSASEDPWHQLSMDPESGTASRHDFRRQLDALEAEFVAVSQVVATMIVPLTTAFLGGDASAARRAVAAEGAVDLRCERLEESCFALIARQAPVAGDLRRIVAVLRSIADVQRAGDLLRHVADALAWVHPPRLPVELSDMCRQMAAVAGQVFAGAVAAWAHQDALAAVELQHLDDDVDNLQKRLLGALYDSGTGVEDAISLALICRYYERIADHGVELARQVTYLVTGDRPALP